MAGGERPTSFVVEAGEAGRLDRLLAARFPGTGRRRWAELIAEGRVVVDGARARKGDRVAAGAQVAVSGAPPVAAAPPPEPALPLEVLHADDRLVAVNKPAGQPSHPLRPGETGTLAGALVARFPECAAAGADPREGGLVHRLDRGTSGVILAARDPASWRALRGAFGAGAIGKRYLALVAGLAADGASDLPLVQRGRRSLPAGPRDRAALPARTSWRVLARGAGASLVEVSAHSGRMHQVRAHLAAAGHPLVGDLLYGGPAAIAGHPIAHPFLHAQAIDLPHPEGGRLVIEAPLPADRAGLLGALGLTR